MKQKRNEYRLQVYLTNLAAQAVSLDEAIRQPAPELEHCR
jgi:hypothetical protein